MGNSNSTNYRIPDELMEEIFLLLPVKSILRSRCVSKQWRSLLESKEFLERRMNQKSHLKLIVSRTCSCKRPPRLLPESSRLEGGEELVYLHCNSPHGWMTCHGLVCSLHADCIHVLNPSTRQLRRFPIGVDKMDSLGFGRDKVTGSYKVVKICPSKECFILSVESGEWRKLSPLPCYVSTLLSAKSVCVNGLIYWLYRWKDEYKLLALDLHKQEFHDVSVPRITFNTRLANLEDRLVMAKRKLVGHEWMLEILTMDVEEGRWSKTYSISLAHMSLIPRSIIPVAFSKQRDLVLYDNHHRLLKYNRETDEICCLSSFAYLIAPYLENLVPLPVISSLVLDSDHSTLCPFFDTPWTSKIHDMIGTILVIFMLYIILFFYGFSFFF